MGYLYIFGTIFFTVYGQLVIKWQVSKAGVMPNTLIDKLWFILHLIQNFWVLSSFLAGFLASLFWMAALTKFELGYAYPFTSLAFVLVVLSSVVMFHETISFARIGGLILIMLGIFIGSRG